MSLTPEQIIARDGKLTASRVACLMTGDPQEILALWQEMTGAPGFVPEDLSAVWPVQLGSTTEALNLDWYERKFERKLILRGQVKIHAAADWAAATLDGYDAADGCVIECKHVGGFEPRETVAARYMPQVHWQMMVMGVKLARLSIIEGAREPVIVEIQFDPDYAAELWSRAEAFMICVRDLTPPVELVPIAPPTPPEKYRTISMEGNNEWASLAVDWLENQAPAKKFDKAAKGIRAMIEADVGKATGHGIVVKRDNRGVSIKPLEA